MSAQTVVVWRCPYCVELIETPGTLDAIDHMLDEHRAELIEKRPLIIMRPRRP